MPIHFDLSRWETIRTTWDLWWNHKLDRPLMNIKIRNAYESDGDKPKYPILNQTNCHDFNIPPEEIIKSIDYDLQKIEYLGDSFPSFNFDVFGPGLLSAMAGGAILDNSSGLVWFHPDKPRHIEEIRVKYDPENKWAKRLKDIYRAGNEKWKGQVLMGMPDFGSNLDVLAVLRTTENLLTDLYDNPVEVLRVLSEIQTAWHEAYNDFSSVLSPVNPGYSDWNYMYSAVPEYILQSDFSYMISPDMFKTFTLPSLKKDCEILNHTIYHLDGIGQIPHLDILLSLDKLNAIQWVPGDGQPNAPYWIELYKRIEAAGKGIHVLGSADDFMKVYSQVKKGLYFSGWFGQNDRAVAEKLLREIGV